MSGKNRRQRQALAEVGRDLAALAAECGALTSFIVLLAAAAGVELAQTMESMMDALYLGVAALCWMIICGSAAFYLRDAAALDEDLENWLEDTQE